MNLINEFANAAQLFLMLCLLFWSFTWNSSPHLDSPPPKSCNTKSQTFPKDVKYEKVDLWMFHQHALPPFSEWKEQERTKYESLKELKSNSHRKMTRRKLNYSSSKCGAKILASNPEAKHRASILNEKADEYLLNPCRVRSWFVIELCDTVEATQVDLANYELYSSSPKEFSVFWSDVYPTVVWHLLGTFEAKDQRTMQTFDLHTKNLWKFMKVIIYSHHGKEHYCPLSVIRVLGYSMVQEYEDKENEKNIPESISDGNYYLGAQDKTIVVPNNESIVMQKEYVRRQNKSIQGFDFVSSSKICSLLYYCLDVSAKPTDEICVDEPVCRFIDEVLPISSEHCNLDICLETSKMFPNITYSAQNKTIKDVSLKSKIVKNKIETENGIRKRTRISEFYKATKGDGSNRKRDCRKNTFHEHENNTDNTSKMTTKALNNTESPLQTFVREIVYTNETILENSTASRKASKVSDVKNSKYNCICKNNTKDHRASESKDLMDIDNAAEKYLSDTEKSIDSAGLIQKDSVLIKLTSRIKALETDLSLINNYLQQLSQSYRHQMEDMQAMLNQTVNAVNTVSEKADLVNNKQQANINALASKMNTLNLKIDYSINGQQDLIRKVVVLHGFFLILEIIIMSTIFTIFLNILHRKNVSFKRRREHFWKIGA